MYKYVLKITIVTNWGGNVLNYNRNGTRSASTAATATGRWIQFWLAMAPTRIFTAKLATANDGDRKDSVTATPLLWCPFLANRKLPPRPSKA